MPCLFNMLAVLMLPAIEGEHAMAEVHNYTVSDYVCTVRTGY